MPDRANKGKLTWQRVARRIRVPMGFAFAAVYLGLAHPSLVTLLLSILLVAPGLWLRGYAAGYVRKNAELTVSGPYAYTRNPLYLGSLMIALGFALAAASWILVVLLVCLFSAIYIPTIQSEEAFLRLHFEGFDAYAAEVPRMIPRLTPAPRRGEPGSFSRALYLQHREYNSLMGSSAIYVALALRFWLEHLHALALHSTP